MDYLEIKNKICGIVIWYNPTSEMVNNIKSYIDQIDKLCIFDNSETDNRILLDREDLKNYNIEYISFQENLGIGKPLNIVAKKVLNQNYDWLLTMDQDSYFQEGALENMYSIIFKNPGKFIYAPNCKVYKKNELNKVEEVKIVITSGNIVRLKKLEKLGFYNEDFFIDEVDHEICYRALTNGMKILKVNNSILNHSLGENFKAVKLIGSKHSSLRKYYITRNKLYMAKIFPFLKIKYYFHIFNLVIRILLFENNKEYKLKMIIKGIKDFRKNIFGKIKN